MGRIEDIQNLNDIVTASHKSLADEVIAKLPGKYDQMLGRRFESGVDLSGGEWQKLALARAYLRDAQLLILDEPTAALDARSEYEVFEQFCRVDGREDGAVYIAPFFDGAEWRTALWCWSMDGSPRTAATKNW